MENQAIVKYQNIIVLTTSQLAEAYGTKAKVISNNFNRNKERYREGKHYISLEGVEKAEFLNRNQFEDGSKNAKIIYLWTEKGAFLHAKSLNTDVAWEVYDRLVDSYFNPPTQSAEPITTDQLSPELQMFGSLYKAIANQEIKQKALEEKVQSQEDTIQSIKDTLTDEVKDYRRWVTKSIGEIATSPSSNSGPLGYQRAWIESYERLEDKYPCALDTMVKDAKEVAQKAGKSKTAIKAINKQTVIAGNEFLRSHYISAIKEMMIAYCV